jgi:hypothetical protein
MTSDELKALAEERRAALAQRGFKVRIRTTPREERTLLESLTLSRQGWIGRAADVNRSTEEVEEALSQIDALTKRIEELTKA